jgi:hypothetical protein
VRAAVAIAALVGALGLAGTALGAAPRAPFRVALGDTVSVAGTSIRCLATGTPKAAGVLCGLFGTGGKELPGSVGVALSARGEAIVIRFKATGPRAIWRVKAGRRAQPGAATVAATTMPRRHVTDVGGVWWVVGTDLRCDVRRAGFQPGVVCSRVDAAGPRKHTNSIAITRLRVGIYRYDGKRRALMEVEEAQPAR